VKAGHPGLEERGLQVLQFPEGRREVGPKVPLVLLDGPRTEVDSISKPPLRVFAEPLHLSS
jgi:hypothetical protein